MVNLLHMTTTTKENFEKTTFLHYLEKNTTENGIQDGSSNNKKREGQKVSLLLVSFRDLSSHYKPRNVLLKCDEDKFLQQVKIKLVRGVLG